MGGWVGGWVKGAGGASTLSPRVMTLPVPLFLAVAAALMLRCVCVALHQGRICAVTVALHCAIVALRPLARRAHDAQ